MHAFSDMEFQCFPLTLVTPATSQNIVDVELLLHSIETTTFPFSLIHRRNVSGDFSLDCPMFPACTSTTSSPVCARYHLVDKHVEGRSTNVIERGELVLLNTHTLFSLGFSWQSPCFPSQQTTKSSSRNESTVTNVLRARRPLTPPYMTYICDKLQSIFPLLPMAGRAI